MGDPPRTVVGIAFILCIILEGTAPFTVFEACDLWESYGLPSNSSVMSQWSFTILSQKGLVCFFVRYVLRSLVGCFNHWSQWCLFLTCVFHLLLLDAGVPSPGAFSRAAERGSAAELPCLLAGPGRHSTRGPTRITALGGAWKRGLDKHSPCPPFFPWAAGHPQGQAVLLRGGQPPSLGSSGWLLILGSVLGILLLTDESCILTYREQTGFP